MMEYMPTRRLRALLVALCLTVLAVATVAGAATKPSARLETPGAPAFVIAHRGWIWVGAHRGDQLFKINPRTNKVVHAYTVSDSVCGVTGSGPDVFVSGCDDMNSRIGVRTGKVRRGPRGFPPLAYAGSLWRLSWSLPGVLQRLDPKTHTVLKTFGGIDSEGPPRASDGSIWIPGHTTLTRVDTRNDTRTVIPLPGAKAAPGPNQGYAVVSNIAFERGTVWVPNPAGIYRVDERTNAARLLPGIHLGDLDQWGDIGFVAAKGSLFIRPTANQVVRIDPATGAVTARYPATGGGGDIAVAFGSLWVTNFISDTTWRIPLR
jgi:hypothetical protein